MLNLVIYEDVGLIFVKKMFAIEALPWFSQKHVKIPFARFDINFWNILIMEIPLVKWVFLSCKLLKDSH